MTQHVTGLVDHTGQSIANDNAENHEKLCNAELAIARDVLSVLAKHYPNHMWTAKTDLHSKYKAVAIQLPVLMPPHAWYVIPMGQLNDDAVMRAGGEILERYRLERIGLVKGRTSGFLEARNKVMRAGIRNAKVPT